MNNNPSRNTENGRVIAGLILIGVGCVLLLRKMGFYFPNWLFSWPVILLLVGLYTGVKNNFRNNSWIILMGIGGFFLLNDIIPGLRLQPFFWPILIIVAGVFFILRPATFKCKDGDNQKWQDTSNLTGETIQDPGSFEVSDFLRLRSIFSGVNRNVLSKNLQGAYVTSVFGGAEVDFTKADINGPVIIKLEVIFGGVKLIVPPHWTVQNEVDGIFHGVDDKRKFSTDTNTTKILILRGSVVFGGVEIKNAVNNKI